MDATTKPPKSAIVFPEPVMDLGTQRRMRLVLGGVLVPILAVGVIAGASMHARPTAAVATLRNVADAHLVEIRDAQNAVVLSGEFRSRIDSLGNTEKDAELVGPQGDTVIGEVELELPAAGRDHLRPELEVDVINLKPRQEYRVVIDDRLVGSFVTDDRGSVDLELQEGESVRQSTQPGAAAVR